jgi:3-hydroxybutyryl-CoA dehydrogenase
MVEKASDVEVVVVVGAGTMGHGIAQVCAMAGCQTRLVDVSKEQLEKGIAAVKANLDKGVERGKVDDAVRKGALANLQGSTELEKALHGAQLMIEAVPERMDLKRKVFQTADELMEEGAVLATNTSSLKVTQIAKATKRPGRVVGLHFFNPVHIMRLVEVIRTDETVEAVVEFAKGFSERLGKTAIVARDVPGFATSRLGIVIGNEAMRMVEEGVASPQDIDTAMKLGYGHPMGPFELSDLVGLDVRLEITKYLQEELGGDQFKPPQVLERLVKEGRLGKKSGAGFYEYGK